MEHQKIEALNQRLDRLERENRWWRRVLGVTAVSVLGFVVLVGATGSKVADEIWARNFVLVNKDGISVAQLSSNVLGEPSLSLYGEDSITPRVVISAGTHSKSGLFLNDTKGINRADLVVQSNGEPILSLYDKEGEKRVGLVSGEDTTALVLVTRDQKRGITMTASNEGGLILGFAQNGHILTQIFSTPLGSSSLSIFGKNGSKAVLGNTKIEVTHTGEIRTRPASSLVLFNKDGKVIWSAP